MVSLLRSSGDKDSNAAILQFKVLIEGLFSDCARFLEKLENAPYLITIEDLNIIRLPNEEGEGFSEEIEFNLSIKVFGL